MAGSPKVTFESLFCIFEFFGVSGSVGGMAGHKSKGGIRAMEGRLAIFLFLKGTGQGGFPDLGSSVPICPFLSFAGLSRSFGGIFPTCRFPLPRPI